MVWAFPNPNLSKSIRFLSRIRDHNKLDMYDSGDDNILMNVDQA